MIWRRRRLVIACLTAFLLLLFYHIFSDGQASSAKPQSAWMRALRGDKDAFQIQFDGSIGNIIAAADREIYPVQNYFELPASADDQPLPPIQYDFGKVTGAGAQSDRQKAVLDAFRHSWDNYKQHAWMADELMPVSAGNKPAFGDWGATLVDTLDTLWMMGFRTEFEEAVEAAENINFYEPDNLPINVFETNIRYLGGFLGAYDISEAQYPVLLRKAAEVANMLYGAFDTYNRMPISQWRKKYGEKPDVETTIADVASLSLEFTRLSQLTGDMKYYDAIQRITDCMDSQQMSTKVPGLFPQIVDGRECKMTRDVAFSLGAFADSAYEYLPKTHHLLKGRNTQYKSMYLRTLSPIDKYLLAKPMTPSDTDILFPLTYKARQPHPDTAPQMQHLSCFAGGMYALGSKLFSRPEDLVTARKITQGCIWAYNATPTGIMPEHFYFHPCPSHNGPCPWNETAWKESLWQRNQLDTSLEVRKLPYEERLKAVIDRTACPRGLTLLSSKQYRLRPEAIESIFVLYRITGDQSLRDDAWRMFQAIEKQTKAEFGYSTIDDVMLPATSVDGAGVKEEVDAVTGRRKVHRKLDRMETFWTAETLKYFYLIFGEESAASLDDYVYNTEAHPLRIT